MTLFSKYPSLFSALIILAFSLTLPDPGQAQTIETSANVALSSDYIYRGVTQTSGGPAISGGFDATLGVFSAGTWASSVDFGDDTTMELDIYADYSPSFAGLDFDFGILAYLYPDSPKGQNFVEFHGGASKAMGPLTLGASYAYSPDFYGNTGEAGYLTLDASWAVNESWSLSAGYGQQDFYQKAKGGDSYADINVGITYSLSGYDFDLRYHDAYRLAGVTGSSVVVASLSRSF